MTRILVSACLLGEKVRCDGRAKTLAHPQLARWQAEGRLVPICPELAGGFGTPRPPAEIIPGGSGQTVLAGCARIVDRTGTDVTAAYLAGAKTALALARAEGCGAALLTDRSPSCGSSVIHDGSFAGHLVTGMGVTAALLSANGISVFAEEGIDALAAHLAQADQATSG